MRSVHIIRKLGLPYFMPWLLRNKWFLFGFPLPPLWLLQIWILALGNYLSLRSLSWMCLSQELPHPGLPLDFIIPDEDLPVLSNTRILRRKSTQALEFFSSLLLSAEGLHHLALLLLDNVIADKSLTLHYGYYLPKSDLSMHIKYTDLLF